jgi:hypothetical protein
MHGREYRTRASCLSQKSQQDDSLENDPRLMKMPEVGKRRKTSYEKTPQTVEKHPQVCNSSPEQHDEKNKRMRPSQPSTPQAVRKGNKITYEMIPVEVAEDTAQWISPDKTRKNRQVRMAPTITCAPLTKVQFIYRKFRPIRYKPETLRPEIHFSGMTKILHAQVALSVVVVCTQRHPKMSSVNLRITLVGHLGWYHQRKLW